MSLVRCTLPHKTMLMDAFLDLATQMRYLTDIPESPNLNRRSRVLSWISESEDMFEGTGAGREETDGSEHFAAHEHAIFPSQ